MNIMPVFNLAVKGSLYRLHPCSCSYIHSYEDYVKKWIIDQIVEHFSNRSTMFELEDQHRQSSSINNDINKAKTKNSDNIKVFVEDVCWELGNKLAISQDALGPFTILNNVDQEH